MWYHLIVELVLLQEIKISLFFLSICTDELMLAPKIMTFFPTPPYAYENSEQESNPMR